MTFIHKLYYDDRNMEEYDFLFKILLIGDSSVGKSCMLIKFVDDDFIEMNISTIGVDFKIKSLVDSDGNKIKMQIWDTAGQERFRTITTSYYRGCHAIMICYDITDKISFENIPYWLKECERYAIKDVPKVLVANKTDLDALRVITYEMGKMCANTYGMDFIEISAKTGENVKKSFELVADCIKKSKKQSSILINRSKHVEISTKFSETNLSKKCCF